MTVQDEKINELNKSEILTNLLWAAFGMIGGIMSLIGILYGYKLIKSLTKK